MSRRFSEEEISNIVQTARIQAPPFTVEEYRKIVQMQQEMKDTEFVRAAWAVYELEEEYGISYSEVLERYRQLLKDKEKLEVEVKGLRQRKEAASKELAGTLEAARQAEQERIRLDDELKVTAKQVEQEKKRLKKDVGRARDEAKLSKKEIVAAGELKDKVERLGLNLNLVLGLCGEFARSRDVADELALAVKEYGSVLEARENLQEENEAIHKEIEERHKESEELLIKCDQTRETLSKLKTELGDETKVRNFFKQFKTSSGLLEYLDDWEDIHPMHCQVFTCNTRFLVEHLPRHLRANFVCPSCGQSHYMYDGGASMKLGLPYGTTLKVKLGE